MTSEVTLECHSGLSRFRVSVSWKSRFQIIAPTYFKIDCLLKAAVIMLNANIRNGLAGIQLVVKTWNERELCKPSAKLLRRNHAMG